MPRDNEELGRFLEALHRNDQSGPGNRKRDRPHVRSRVKVRAAQLKDFVGLKLMLALLWGAHWLMRSATWLFFNGFLSANRTRTVLRWAARLNRASLAVLRHRQRRRFFNYHAGNDNNDRRT